MTAYGDPQEGMALNRRLELIKHTVTRYKLGQSAFKHFYQTRELKREGEAFSSSIGIGCELGERLGFRKMPQGVCVCVKPLQHF